MAFRRSSSSVTSPPRPLHRQGCCLWTSSAGMPRVRTGLGALRQRGAASRAPRPITNPWGRGDASDSHPERRAGGVKDLTTRIGRRRIVLLAFAAPRRRSRPGYSSLQRRHQGNRNRGTAVEQRKRQRALATVGHSVKNDKSPKLRDITPKPVDAQTQPSGPAQSEDPARPHEPDGHRGAEHARCSEDAGDAPSFDGIGFPGVNCDGAPPDTNGEVGATQYVQIVNTGLQVFDKSTGSSVLGPISIESGGPDSAASAS